NGKEPYGKTAAGQFRQRPTRTGGFPGNSWGFQDMHGNVAEWTNDWYGAYPADDATDPAGPESGDARVVRGGSWKSDAASTRCAAARVVPGARFPLPDSAAHRRRQACR